MTVRIYSASEDTRVNVEIWNDGQHQFTGTHLKVGGVEIPEFSNVTLEHRAGQVAKVTAEVYAISEFSVTLPAEVTVNVMMLPGFEFEIEENKTEKSVIYTVREKKAVA